MENKLVLSLVRRGIVQLIRTKIGEDKRFIFQDIESIDDVNKAMTIFIHEFPNKNKMDRGIKRFQAMWVRYDVHVKQITKFDTDITFIKVKEIEDPGMRSTFQQLLER